MTGLFQDLRYATRQLRKSAGFTAVAVTTLALGIGANTAVFSVVDQVLLHPLPYPGSDRMVKVSQTFKGLPTDNASPANYLDWVSQNHVFSEMAASRGWQGSLSAEDRPEQVRGAMTTPSFFPLFGVNPILGRGLEPVLTHDPVTITLWCSDTACGNATLRQIARLLAGTSGSMGSSTRLSA